MTIFWEVFWAILLALCVFFHFKVVISLAITFALFVLIALAIYYYSGTLITIALIALGVFIVFFIYCVFGPSILSWIKENVVWDKDAQNSNQE